MVRYKILFAEDVPDDMELAEIELKRAGISFESRRTETRNDFIEQLKSFQPHVVISDYSMPNFNGMDALKLVQQHLPDTPVIIHTGSINEETAVKCMKAGAYDYVLKEKILRLPYALKEAYERSVIQKQNRESQNALKISEEKYKGLFNSIVQGVFYLDKNGEISTINPAACKILFFNNHKRNTLDIFIKEWELTTEEAQVFDFRRYLFLNGAENNKVVTNQVVNAHHLKSGVKKSLLLNIIPQNHSPELEALVVIEDITERKIAENDLIQAKLKAEESDRLKSAFLANLSHEVRTPMNAILGFSELLSELNKEDETEKLYIETIQNNSAKLLGIITDIIEMSKIETEKIVLYENVFELKALNDVIRDVYQPVAHSKGVELVISGLDDNIRVTTDEQRLKKVILNLVDNALKFTDDGMVKITCKLHQNKMELHVIDTGCGVPAGHEELIFQRFRQADESFSRKHGGTGLGLSIAKAYIEALGGKIWYSPTKKGSDFAFYIPLKSQKIITEGVKVLEKNGYPDYSLYKFLVAEDDATNFAYLTKILAPTGVKILYASNGAEAVDLASDTEDIDVILMDIKMPVMDGFEATEKIRKSNTSIPIIATTAYAMSGDKEKCLAIGCNAYISKPLRKNELYETINKHLVSPLANGD